MRFTGRFSWPILQCYGMILLTLITLLASGCGTSENTAVRRSGTQRPYSVRGKTYYPLSNASGYSEVGRASWYGPGFHGKRTSCGEVYDMEGITAAHKILPMHTKVRVTNLDNGKTLVVRVNDRGPFVSGRIIDLSRGAASQLGVLKTGTALVRVETVESLPGGGRIDDLPGPFYVQVGAFRNKVNADRLLNQLRQAGYTGSRLHYGIVNGLGYNQVHAGAFKSLGAAKHARNRLEPRFADAFVIAQ
ncbi:septal ring lytic transglycosylase RlpA family protein [Desulfovibrio inopinatus]|uniref:septal ring lytic transglycosylase RlpA family protein n=1 Tax=Desulfovibrio inopinatus TaxID=102109 RepID=UPI0004261CF5|nr:septal ring lytic transglycosylase RlpA family protein [Desulfovibrio inopinatus]